MVGILKGDVDMDIIQTFYDNLASQYDKLFLDWQSSTHEQALILNKLFRDNGFDDILEVPWDSRQRRCKPWKEQEEEIHHGHIEQYLYVMYWGLYAEYQ